MIKFNYILWLLIHIIIIVFHYMKYISSAARMRFEGKVAIVTGAGQGIGRGIVLELA